MLKMTAYTDVQTLRILGTEVPGAQEAVFCYVAENHGEVEGTIFFGARTNCVVLLGAYLKTPGDLPMMDGLLRAGLNFAVNHGMAHYYIPPQLAMLCGCSLEQMQFTIGRDADTMRFFDSVKQCGL